MINFSRVLHQVRLAEARSLEARNLVVLIDAELDRLLVDRVERFTLLLGIHQLTVRLDKVLARA